MNKTLNDTQKKLVQDNHNLIYSFLKLHSLRLDAVEDWYSAAAIGLCNAAISFDKSKNVPFSVFAYVCMENVIRQIMKDGSRSINATESLDNSVAEGCSIADMVQDSEDPFFQIYLNDAVSNALKSTNERDKQILSLIIQNGYKQKEIAEMYGIAKNTVSTVYNKFINKVRAYFDD